VDWSVLFGDVVMFTGWTFEQVGALTIPQLRSVLAAVNRRKKEQIEMWGGEVKETGGEKVVAEADMLERKLALMKARTGRDKFDLREVL
jgi:hypothetical protein